MCSRQVGKTTMLLADMFYTAYTNPGCEVMLIIPVYKTLDPILTKLFRMVPDFAIEHWNKQQGIITVSKPLVDEDGVIRGRGKKSLIWLRSADRPDTLRGPTLHSAYMDEATIINDPAVWFEVIEPMLAITRQQNRGGRALLAAKPKGTAQWVYDLWKRGQDPEVEGIASWKVTAHDCPRYTPEYLSELEESMTENSFRQEYLAEWVNTEGRLFHNIDACVKGELEEPKAGRKYIIGADFGKKIDYSVFVVLDVAANKVVGFERMKLLPYPVVEARLANLSHKYNGATVIYDSTQRTEEIYRSLRRNGVQKLMPFYFTKKSKNPMVEELALNIEKKTISFPKIMPLIREMEVFRVTKNRDGTMRYSAPSSHHDDAIIALALAVYGKKRALRKACGRNTGGIARFRPDMQREQIYSEMSNLL